jgi:hypothetical protein
MLVELKAVLKELQKKRLELQIKGQNFRCGLAAERRLLPCCGLAAVLEL